MTPAPIVPGDIDPVWLAEWCSPHDRADCPPAEALLLDACPVVFDPAQYARAAALGLSGRLASVLFESVTFKGSRFRLAQHCEDQAGAEVAFLLPVLAADGEIADALAWIPETGKTATLTGAIGALGLWALSDPRLEPPAVHESLLDWLLAEETGLFVLDAKLAAKELDGVTVASPDVESALRLRARLAPHCKRAPKIVVLKSNARRAG